VLCLLPATATGEIMLNQNYFPESKRHMLGFCSSNFTVLDHILSTIGDALREGKWTKDSLTTP
jgi:hypothetical protein